MSDSSKTKQQLIDELAAARQRITQLDGNNPGATETELRESLQATAEITQAIPSGLFVYRYEGPDQLILLDGNPAAELMTGLNVKEVVGKTFDDIWPGAREAGITGAYLNAAQTGEIYQKEDEYYEDEQLTGSFKTTVFPIAGSRIGVAFENITEQRQNEIKFKRVAEGLFKYKSAVEQSADGIAVADLQGNIQIVNPAWATMHGYEADEIQDKNLSMFHTAEQIQTEVAPFSEQAMQNGSHEGEVGHVKRDGTTFPTWMTSTVLTDEDGTPVGLVSIARDIAEQKQTQAEQERLLTMLSNSDSFIGMVDMEGSTIYVNPTGLQMAGYDNLEQVLGMKIADFHEPEDAERILKECLPIVFKEGSWRGENRLRRTDGTLIPVEQTLFLIHDTYGQPQNIATFITDITEQKQAQAEREQLQQEVIEAQRHAIAELSTPVIPIMDRIIVMPLVGSIDSLRARDITRTLLAGIGAHRAKVVILDVTGVAIMDTGVVNHLNKTIQAARLKGARTIVTGISDSVAEAIVDLGIDWSNLETLSDLQTGLVTALDSLGVKLSR